MATEAQAEFAAAADGFFDRSTEAARELLGTSRQTEQSGTALTELNQRINDLIAERAAHQEHAQAVDQAGVRVVNSKVELAARRAGPRRSCWHSNASGHWWRATSRRPTPRSGRPSRHHWLLQRQALLDIVRLLRERAALENDTAAREQMLTRADAFDQRLAGIDQQTGALGPDPTSMGQQMMASLTQLQTQFGTVAQQVARGFSSVIGGAVDGIAESLAGLIQGTMDWGDALRNVARTMGTAVVNAISRMFAEWVVGRALMAMKNILFSQQEGAADAAAKAPVP